MLLWPTTVYDLAQLLVILSWAICSDSKQSKAQRAQVRACGVCCFDGRSCLRLTNNGPTKCVIIDVWSKTHREGEGGGEGEREIKAYYHQCTMYNPRHTEQKRADQIRAEQCSAEKKRESIYGNGYLLLSQSSSPTETYTYEFWWFEFRHLKWGPDAKLQCLQSVMSKFWSTHLLLSRKVTSQIFLNLQFLEFLHRFQHHTIIKSFPYLIADS